MSADSGSKGLVSVVIPVHGTEAYLSQTLDSVRSQTYTSYEIIIVNDGSPGSALIETIIAPYRNRLEYISQENRGASAARSVGVKAARGEYVAHSSRATVEGCV
jgi:glycosyltransferase involved in cell wall biosynthesis